MIDTKVLGETSGKCCQIPPVLCVLLAPKRLRLAVLMRPALALTLVLSFASLARAQSTHASLAGRLTDPSRAIIVNAIVTAINTETSVRHQTTTNDAGQYYVTNP
jgi:hypothetical protein